MYGVTQRQEAWQRWQAAAGPWVSWSLCLALVAPTQEGIAVSEHDRPRRDVDSLSAQLSRTLGTDGTAIQLDLEPTLGVQVAARLHCLQLAHVVLVLPRWPHADAILPTAELIATLVDESRRLALTDEQFRHAVIVLDAERHKRVDRPADDSRIDNRYHVSIGDLPKLADLRRAGLRRIVKVTHA